MANDKLTTISHAEAIEWAMQALEQSEINTAVIVETPWSNVLKISTPQGSVYLKQTPPDLFIEVDVIKKCRELCGTTDIPEVIAASKDLHCFLMKECGDASLRTVFDGHLNVDLLVQGLQIYTKIQKATAPHVDAFLQAGVPDWRLEHFPKLYQDLVSNKEFLKAHGLETAQIKILQDAARKVEALCQELSNYEIPECLNHSDFHENNMLFSRTTQKVPEKPAEKAPDVSIAYEQEKGSVLQIMAPQIIAPETRSTETLSTETHAREAYAAEIAPEDVALSGQISSEL